MSLYIFYFESAAFVTSLLAWPYLKEKIYFKVFPLLLFIVVTVEAYVTFARSFSSFIYNIQVPVQHLLYLAIIFLAMEEGRYRKITIGFIIALVIIVPLSIIFLTEKNHINTSAYCAGATFIIISALMKFYEMLQNPRDYNFLSLPFFYLLFVYLLFTVGTLPYFTMGNWLYYTMKRPDILNVFVNVMTVFNYILYSTYTIVFLWIIRRKASY